MQKKSNSNVLPEEKLLTLLRNGEESAYRDIYKRHYAILCHYAQTFLRDGFLSEAVVNDTIYHLWEIRENVLITSSLRQYLMSAVRNRCLNYLKANRRENASLEDAVRVYLGEEVVLGKMLAQEQEKALMDAIEDLPEECRTVFKMSRFDSYRDRQPSRHICKYSQIPYSQGAQDSSRKNFAIRLPFPLFQLSTIL